METIVDKKLAAVGYGSRYGVEGYYAPGQNVVYFSRNTLPSSNVVQEEFVHAAQDRVYDEGIQTYAGKTGASNIEFEAKFLMFIIGILNDSSGLQVPLSSDEDVDIFEEWITLLGIYDTNPTFPSMTQVINTITQSKDYYYFVESFKNSGEDMYNQEIDRSLKPQLINYINNSYEK